MEIGEQREGADGSEDFDGEGWVEVEVEVEAEKQSGEDDEGREEVMEVGCGSGRGCGCGSREVGSCERVKPGGEAVPDERMRGIGLGSGNVTLCERRDEVRKGGVGGEVIPDKQVGWWSGLSGVGRTLISAGKRAVSEVSTRATFYPAVAVNIGRSAIYPDHHWIDRVDQDIFLGAVPLPGYVALLKELGVTAVVSLTQECESLVDASTYRALGISQLKIPTPDFYYPPTQEHISEAVDFIHATALAGGTTLVHCKAGRARSATVVLCYLVKYRKMTPETALDHVKSIRPRVSLVPLQLQAVNDFATRLSSMENSGEGSIRDSDPEVHQECAFDVNVVLSDWYGLPQAHNPIMACRMPEDYRQLETILLNC